MSGVRFIRDAKMALFATLLAALPAGARANVVIPGPIRSVSSPDGSGARIFYREHTTPDGGQDSPVFYDDGHGRIRQVATMQRNMEIGWSPDGKSLFIQDNWGSNISDCYVLTRKSGGIAGVSLLKLIQRTAGHPRGAEGPNMSHFYVYCEAWRSARQIAGDVNGHTESSPLHFFDYPFEYDVGKHRLSWQHTEARRAR